MKRLLFLSLFLTCLVGPVKAANINDATLINTKQLTQNVVFVDKYTTTDLCATTTGAIDQIGSTVTTLIISEAVTCTLNKTAPSTLTFQFMGQGQITISSTKTLTVYSPEHIVAPTRSKIVAGGGLLAFTRGGTIHPGWWGAAFDGSTNDATAIQAAITAAPAKSRIALPGIAAIGTAGLLVSGKTDFVIDGQEGIGGIKALGVSTQTVVGSTVLAVKSCTRCVVTGLRFDGNAIASNLIGVQDSSDSEISRNSTTSGGTNAAIMAVGNTRNRYLRNTVQDTIGAARGMWIGNVNTVEAENDGLIEGNTVKAAAASGILYTGYNGRVLGNQSIGNAGAGIAISAAASAGVSTANTIIANNIVRGNALHGIQSDSSLSTDYTDSITVSGNLAEKNNGSGIYAVRARNWTITGNTCRDNNFDAVGTGSGIQIEEAKRITVTGNSSYDTRSGASRTQSNGIGVVAQVGVLDVEEVLISGNSAINNLFDGIIATTSGSGTSDTVSVIGNQCHNNGARGIMAVNAVVNGSIINNVCHGNTSADIRVDIAAITLENNVFSTSTNYAFTATGGTLTVNSATPSVAGRRQWREANTSPTTITSLPGGINGQEIVILFTSANTTLTDGGTLKLNGGFTSTADDMMKFVFDGINWYEISRSVN